MANRVSYSATASAITARQRIAKVVIIGAAASKLIAGFADAYDARTGQRAWHFTVGDPSSLSASQRQPLETPLTISGPRRRTACGTPFLDPEADLIAVNETADRATALLEGQGQSVLCSILAVKPDTELQMVMQNVPGDS